MSIVSSNVSNLTVNIPNGRTESFTADLRVPVNNLLFGVLGYMKSRKDNKITLSYKLVNNLAGLDYDTEPRITTQVINEFVALANPGIAFKSNGESFDIIGAIDYKTDSNKYDYEYLFSRISMGDDEVTFEVNENKTYLIYTELESYSKFKMRDYLLIDDKYAKTLYRMLVRFKSSAWRKIRIDDLKLSMGKPDMATSKFIERHVIPSVELLNNLNLNIFDIVLYKNKKGRAFISVEFKFKVKSEIEELERTIEINKSLMNSYLEDIISMTNLTQSEFLLMIDERIRAEELLTKEKPSYREILLLECRINDYKRFLNENESIYKKLTKINGSDNLNTSESDPIVNMPTNFEEL